MRLWLESTPFLPQYNGMRPYDQLCLFVGHLGWVDESALVGFPDFVGNMLRTNPNIGGPRIDRIVDRVRVTADDLVFVSHLS